MSERIAYLDGWRGLAIIFVIIDHFSRGYVGWAGDFGVELFFILSGTLMADILFLRQSKVGPFLVRRMSRVYPALAVFGTAMFLVSLVALRAGLPAQMGVSVPEYLSAITFSANYYEVITGSNSVLGHIWSLSVEEQSYIILLLIAAVTSRKVNNAIAVMLLLSFIAFANGLYLTEVKALPSHAVYWRTDVRISSILFPASLFLLLRQQRMPQWLSIACVLVGMGFFWVMPAWTHFTAGTAILAVGIVSLPQAHSWFRDFLSNKILTGVGVLSYSVYLWQQPFYKVSERTGWIFTVPLLLTMIVASYCSYRFVEDPARRWINRRFQQRGERSSHVRAADFEQKNQPAHTQMPQDLRSS